MNGVARSVGFDAPDRSTEHLAIITLLRNVKPTWAISATTIDRFLKQRHASPDGC
jgi:hypothetical protein